MSKKTEALADRLQQRYDSTLTRVVSVCRELTYELPADQLLDVCRGLRDEFGFEMLMDVCGVDYLGYGQVEWLTNDASDSGFSRGVNRETTAQPTDGEIEAGRRFAAVYHLQSISQNVRLRLKVFAPDNDAPIVDSVVDIWNSANWYEREAFDLFGILFRGHPDMRRLLTDYGFIGHPFRKDFPLIGNVEVIYDPDKQRVVYQPVSIEERTLVPKVIRKDSRYQTSDEPTDGAGDDA